MNASRITLSEDQLKVFDQTRYLLVKRAGLMFASILAVVAVVNSVHAHYTPTPDIAALILIIICLFILFQTRNYRLVTKIAVLGSSITLVIALFTIKGYHLTTPIWMVNCIVFAYLVLEKFWGALITVINFGGLAVYLLTIFEGRMNDRFLIQPSDSYIFLVEFSIEAGALAYVMHVFLSASQTSERYLVENHQHVKEQNLIISRQKNEIEMMLKEIHHRVKNNLQIISSLLRLHSNISNDENRGILQESVNRVNTMAMIHEKMYKSDTFQQFDLSNYVENLVVYICDSYQIGTEIKAKIHVENMEVSTNSMVPIAMIINELISNSIKHAFENQPRPKIELSITSLPESRISMIYKDNGVWKDTEDSFGSEIILAMTDQLEGSKAINKSENGTTYDFQLSNL